MSLLDTYIVHVASISRRKSSLTDTHTHTNSLKSINKLIPTRNGATKLIKIIYLKKKF